MLEEWEATEAELFDSVIDLPEDFRFDVDDVDVDDVED